MMENADAGGIVFCTNLVRMVPNIYAILNGSWAIVFMQSIHFAKNLTLQTFVDNV